MFATDNAGPVVLVVDDDPEVRETLTNILETRGYTVIDAATGREALDILERDETIGILFTDVIMPGISGITLAKRAMEMRPGLKVVLASAYTGEGAAADLPVLKKPFQTADLLAALEGGHRVG
jgi:CheY-like chemotaxis protein